MPPSLDSQYFTWEWKSKLLKILEHLLYVQSYLEFIKMLNSINNLEP